MTAKLTILLIAIVVSFLHAAKLPTFYKKCKKSDPDLSNCLLKNAIDGMPMFALGDNAHHIQSVSPLRVPYVHINVNGGLIINIKDAVLAGFENVKFSEVSVDLKEQAFTLRFNAPVVRVQGEYDIKGRILILPITGAGPCNITFVEPACVYTFDYDVDQRNNKEIIIPKNTKLVYTANRVHFQLDNLFNGDKRLGEQMAIFLDENWREVNEEIGTKLGEAIGEIFSSLLSKFFNKVPISEMFDD